MVSVTYKKLGLRIEHIWFGNGEPTDKLLGHSKSDIAFVHGITEMPQCRYYLMGRQNSLIKNLDCTEDELWSTFGKHLKSYIKRSIREEIDIEMFDDFSDKAKREELFTTVGALYEKMFFDKGMKNSFNKELARKYADGGNLFIIVARMDGVTVGFQAAIHDDKTAREWVSAFDYRNEAMDSQMLSRAHQNLQWQALNGYRRRGITSADLGGVVSFDEPNGIDSFKMRFEKDNRVTYSNLLIGKTMLGRIAVRAFSFYRKLRGVQ